MATSCRTFYTRMSNRLSRESRMADPLAQIVSLLQPGAPFSKCVTGSGPWRVRRTQSPNPYYVAVLDGSLRYWDYKNGEVAVHAGDFILIPSAQDFMMWSAAPSSDNDMVTDPVILPGGGYRVGRLDGPTDMRALVGYASSSPTMRTCCHRCCLNWWLYGTSIVSPC